MGVHNANILLVTETDDDGGDGVAADTGRNSFVRNLHNSREARVDDDDPSGGGGDH